MRARTEAALALLGLAGVALVAGVAGRSVERPTSPDRRPSSFLAGPEGSRALLEAAQRLGIEVRRFRERPGGLSALAGEARQMLVILDPSARFSPPELEAVLRFGQEADLLLAGPEAAPLMRCFGYRINRRHFDSVQVSPPDRGAEPADPWVQEVLERTYEREAIDSSRRADWGRFRCEVPPVSERQPLLVAGQAVAAV
ncbi:MAG TPA: DUF4350 domain-containing protein, partial [Gemmatimonadales bacterium]|nr:DUF4350 domain-containing protein [Gemmatimonadales bacterium]